MTVALLVGIWTIIMATLIPAVRVGAWYVRVFDFPRAQIGSLGLLLGELSVWLLPLGDWFTALSLFALGLALDPRLGRRPMATFPVNGPFLRLPLDHIFFSGSVR